MDNAKFDTVVRALSIQQKNTKCVTPSVIEFVIVVSSDLTAFGKGPNGTDAPIFYEFVCRYDFSVNAVTERYVFITVAEQRVGTLYNGIDFAIGAWLEHINYIIESQYETIVRAGRDTRDIVPAFGPGILSTIFEEHHEPSTDS